MNNEISEIGFDRFMVHEYKSGGDGGGGQSFFTCHIARKISHRGVSHETPHFLQPAFKCCVHPHGQQTVFLGYFAP